MKTTNWLKLKIKVSRKTYNKIQKVINFQKKNKKEIIVGWIILLFWLLVFWKKSRPKYKKNLHFILYHYYLKQSRNKKYDLSS